VPRLKRMDVAGVAQHVVQRGNDRQPCFFRETDYVRYRQDLGEALLRFGCRLHAYVLMTNHVHLLLTPSEAGAVGRVMQALGRRYVRYVNDTLGRSGTLWEGRYKSCLVDSEQYVLACYRYIELNPLRAGMVAEAGGYRWSSHGCNADGHEDPLVSPHPSYLGLGIGPEERRECYRELLAFGLGSDELAAIRLYVQRQRALGSERFQAQIEQHLARRAGIGQPGRPRTRAAS